MIIVKETELSYPYNKLYLTATVQIFCQCHSLLPTSCMQINKTNLNVNVYIFSCITAKSELDKGFLRKKT